MHNIVVLALPHTILFDLATPLEVLGRACDHQGRAAYHVTIAAAESVVDAGPLQLLVGRGLDALDDADTVVLPGRDDPGTPIPRDVLDALRAAVERGARLMSICVGAFTLAATGLLDGRRATTHWRAAELFRALHPTVRLDPAVLYVDDGELLTSAGAAAGIDLCLHLVERDLGAAAAAETARLTVSPLHREGGQAQYVPRRLEVSSDSPLGPVLAWVAEHSDRDLTIGDIATHAGLSQRTLNRRFRDETGQAPRRWLTRVRMHQARELLETTDASVEQIAQRVGFRAPSTFRAAFTDAHGVAPRTYRQTFHASVRAGGAESSYQGIHSLPRPPDL